MKRRIITGLGLFLALTLFTTSVYAEDEPDYPFFRVNVLKTDKNYEYIDFYPAIGEYSRTEKQGFNLDVDYSSISYQSVLITVTADPGQMQERGVTKFYVILPSGEVVDQFDAMFYPEEQVYKSYYYRNATLTDDYIGANVTLQVVAVSGFGSAETEYIVGWTQPVGPFQLKPLPVKDKEANGWLQAIYEKLKELTEMLKQALANLQKAIEDAYKPSEEAKQKLDDAINQLTEKMPMNEIMEQMDEVTETLEETKRQLKQPGSKMIIGEDFYLIPPEMNHFTARYGLDSTVKSHLIDLTQFKKEVELMRKIMQAALWVYFFHMLIGMLTPKPRL